MSETAKQVIVSLLEISAVILCIYLCTIEGKLIDFENRIADKVKSWFKG